MSETAVFWTAIIAVSLGTLLLRTVPLATHGRVKTPKTVRRLLAHLPAAALAALAAPGVLFAEKTGYGLEPIQIAAGIVALLVALKFKGIFSALLAGMVALWVMQALF